MRPSVVAFAAAGVLALGVGLTLRAHLASRDADQLLETLRDQTGQAVERALAGGANADATTRWNEPVLNVAARRGHVGAVTALVRAGAHVDERDGSGKSAVTDAAAKGHLQVVRILVEAGADPSGRGERLDTPLVAAARGGHAAVVAYLLENGARPDGPRPGGLLPLFLAAENGHADVVDLLLKAGANPETRDHAGRTAAEAAAQHGHASVLSCFDAKQVSGVNVENARLVGAVERADLPAVAGSLARGARPDDAHGPLGDPVLGLAANAGELAIVRALVEHGARVDIRGHMELTPLIRAAWTGHRSVVEYLLSAGADVARGSGGATALNGSSHRGRSDVVEVLLRAGADPKARDSAGYTVFALARRERQSTIVRMLINRGARE